MVGTSPQATPPSRTAWPPGAAQQPRPTPSPAGAPPSAPKVRSRGRKLGRSLALPAAALGLAVLLPWRAIDVLHQWQALTTRAEAAEIPQSAPQIGGQTPAVGATTPAPAAKAVPATQTAATTIPPMTLGGDCAPDGRLVAEIAQRTAALDQRDQDLRTRAAQVAAAEQLARQQIAELSRLRQQIEKLVAQESQASEADIKLLVGLYSNMKPTQAAVVLGRLDPVQAAEILQRLDTHQAGPILAAMEPSAALAVTKVLATRRVAFRN